MNEVFKYVLINERSSIMEVSEILRKSGINNRIVKAPVSIVNNCRFAILIKDCDLASCKKVIGNIIISII